MEKYDLHFTLLVIAALLALLFQKPTMQIEPRSPQKPSTAIRATSDTITPEELESLNLPAITPARSNTSE